MRLRYRPKPVEKSIELQEKIYEQTREDYRPWRETGERALLRIEEGITAGDYDQEEFSHTPAPILNHLQVISSGLPRERKPLSVRQRRGQAYIPGLRWRRYLITVRTWRRQNMTAGMAGHSAPTRPTAKGNIDSFNQERIAVR